MAQKAITYKIILSLVSTGFIGYWLGWAACAILFSAFLFVTTVFYVGHKFGNANKWLAPSAIVFVAGIFFFVRSAPVDIGSFISISALTGFSFLVFRLIHLLFEYWRNLLSKPKPLDLFLYLSFFPLYLAGPIEFWKPFQQKIISSVRIELFKRGLTRIGLAIPIKLLLVDQLIVGKWQENAMLNLSNHPSIGTVLLFGLIFYMRAYFDLKAYSDVAIGACNLLGYEPPENLDRPWSRTNLSDFWRSWHMSVTNWCTYHVYFPIFGRFRIPALATFCSMMTMAFWHGSGINWMAWGAHHSLGLIIHSYWTGKMRWWRRKLSKRQQTAYTCVSWILTQIFVVVGYFYVGNGFKAL